MSVMPASLVSVPVCLLLRLVLIIYEHHQAVTLSFFWYINALYYLSDPGVRNLSH